MMKSSELQKGNLPSLADPEHLYVFKSGFYGLYDFWYIDPHHNYWKYTNAPEDHEDYDPLLGIAVKSSDQPTPETNPQFYSGEGKKRHMGVPPDVMPEPNENYDPIDLQNIWYEAYDKEGEVRYVYLDSDIRENIDMWVQYMMRVTDSNIPKLRSFAVDKFESFHAKDKIIGAVLMLMDQGLFELEPLMAATVRDCEFIDTTVKLLGRKIICDPPLLEFFQKLVTDRDPDAPLFVVENYQGEGKFGLKHMASILRYLKITPPFLLSWHASHIFSRIMNRLVNQGIEPGEIEAQAFGELRRAFGTQKDLQHLVDVHLRKHLMTGVVESAEAEVQQMDEEEEVEKSMIPLTDTDAFSTIMVFSDLMGRRKDEIEFSIWLHAQPMHEIAPEEQQEIDAQVGEKVQQVLEGDPEAEEGEEEGDEADDAGSEAPEELSGDVE